MKLSLLFALLTLQDVDGVKITHKVDLQSSLQGQCKAKSEHYGVSGVGPALIPSFGCVMPDGGSGAFFEEPVPECKTNQILVDNKCECPAGLVPNPVKQGRSDPIVNTHYIFALDRSGSMTMWGNDYWTPLMEGFEGFILTAQQSPLAYDNTRVSVTAYDDRSEQVIFNEKAQSKLVDKIEYTGYATNFVNPMNDIIYFLDQTKDEFDKFKIFFMTDGEADYPGSQVRTIINLPYYDKIQFNAIAYGDANTDTIERMGLAFPGGSFQRTEDPDKLLEMFVDTFPKQYQDCVCPDGLILIDGNCE